MFVRCASIAIAGLALAISSGCDGSDKSDLPSGIAARVGDGVITEAAVRHAVIGQVAVRHSEENQPPYWASDVQGCVRTRAARSSSAAVSREELERQCRQDRDRARVAALRLLIQGRWYRLEARRRGVAPLPVKQEYVVRASLHSGVQPRDLADVIKIFGLRTFLAPAPGSLPSASEIRRYYEAHRDRYVTHAQQLIEAVVAPTQAVARDVAAGLRRRASAKKLAARYRGAGVTRPFTDTYLSTLAAEDAAVPKTASRLGRGGVGMVRVSDGWYVMKVAYDIPSKQQTLEQARSKVEQDLQARDLQASIDALTAKLRDRYRGVTKCAEGYEVPDCES